VAQARQPAVPVVRKDRASRVLRAEWVQGARRVREALVVRVRRALRGRAVRPAAPRVRGALAGRVRRVERVPVAPAVRARAQDRPALAEAEVLAVPAAAPIDCFTGISYLLITRGAQVLRVLSFRPLVGVGP
jgi:hypothetical protein